jgi:hypothetical protein
VQRSQTNLLGKHDFKEQNEKFSTISGFRRDADEICALLGYNAASSGKGLPLNAAL